jgi:hypothetical protein
MGFESWNDVQTDYGVCELNSRRYSWALYIPNFASLVVDTGLFCLVEILQTQIVKNGREIK